MSEISRIENEDKLARLWRIYDAAAFRWLFQVIGSDEDKKQARVMGKIKAQIDTLSHQEDMRS